MKVVAVIGTFNTDDPELQVEFDKARETLVVVRGARPLFLRKRDAGHGAVQIVLVERSG